ncbi:anthranilate phosphoribosyltransferase [Perlabentimonas gracilis]|uniref:anthranilate phosphoribosyltransferase n=1 Tax=Perlabentimonas gracilis TaxID=2715279 RepID=UPI001409D6BE|nr:anthranilate phosphoribosyltransferase [Perlabentimonas gracilis]NHB68852.1 anthranilate phosphoribosyltransferase [Perlabentimonas gracilis]
MEVLKKLIDLKELSRNEARDLMSSIAQGDINDARVSAMLTLFLVRSISLNELVGFREILLDLAVPVDLGDLPTIDLCGTGGDGKNTFNISTLSAFVVAGAGIPVAKHGNYGLSSISGSSNVMEYFGYKFSNSNDKLRNEMNKAGLTFLHAPLFHPALKAVEPVRKQLGIKTIFNILGPLVNPARPKYQVSGVYNLEVARLYNYLLQKNHEGYMVVHSVDGYDEVSLTSEVKIFSNMGEDILSPADFGFETLTQQSLHGGDSVEDAANIFINVLKGEGTVAQNNAVIANSALAIACYKGLYEIKDAVSAAKDSLESGSAYRCFKTLIDLQK